MNSTVKEVIEPRQREEMMDLLAHQMRKQALLLSAGSEITTGDLLGAGSESNVAEDIDLETPATDQAMTFREAKERTVQNFERRFLEEALRRSGGNITRAAESVGMYRQSFQQKMRELGITADHAVNGEQKGVRP